MRQSWKILAVTCVAKLAIVSGFAEMTAPAHADWREDLGALRIGVVVNSGRLGALEKFEPFRLAVQEKLEISVEIYPARDLPSLIRAHTSGKVEYAVLTASAYAAGVSDCSCIEPLAIPRAADGSAAVNSVVITRADSRITDPKQLSGKKVLALSPNSVAGYGLAVHELMKQGMLSSKDAIKAEFAGSAQEAISRFSSGQADALIGWSSFIGDPSTGYSRGTLKILSNDADAGAYRTIWKSSPVPHRVHSIRKNLAVEAKKSLQDLLGGIFVDDPVAYDSIEPVYGGGFVLAKPGQFKALVEFVKSPMRKAVDASLKDVDADPQDTAPQGEEPDTSAANQDTN